MNITPNLLPNFRADKADREPTDEERREERIRERLERRRLGLDLGPRKLRTTTTGQARRKVVREAKTAQRKAAKRHRRAWMAQQRSEAYLVGAVRQAEQDTPLGRNALQGLFYGLKGEVDGRGNLVTTPEQALAYAKEIAEPLIARRALQRLAQNPAGRKGDWVKRA